MHEDEEDEEIQALVDRYVAPHETEADRLEAKRLAEGGEEEEDYQEDEQQAPEMPTIAGGIHGTVAQVVGELDRL